MCPAKLLDTLTSSAYVRTLLAMFRHIYMEKTNFDIMYEVSSLLWNLLASFGETLKNSGNFAVPRLSILLHPRGTIKSRLPFRFSLQHGQEYFVARNKCTHGALNLSFFFPFFRCGCKVRMTLNDLPFTNTKCISYKLSPQGLRNCSREICMH